MRKMTQLTTRTHTLSSNQLVVILSGQLEIINAQMMTCIVGVFEFSSGKDFQ